MFYKRWNYLAGALVLVGSLAVTLTGQAAWAQSDTGGSHPADAPTHIGRPGPRPDDGLREIIDPAVIKSAVADALGITVAELEASQEAHVTLDELAQTQGVAVEDVIAAAKAAAQAQVDQALTDGKITQEQADALTDRINNTDFPLGGPGHRGPGEEHGRPDDGLRNIIDPTVIKSAIADALGITVAELEAAHDAGTTLEELAQTQGVAIEDVTAAAKAAAIGQVNQALSDGKITQEQADALIDRINNSDFPLGGPGHRSPDEGDGPRGPRPDDSTPDDGDTQTGGTNADSSSTTARDAASTTAAVYLPLVTR